MTKRWTQKSTVSFANCSQCPLNGSPPVLPKTAKKPSRPLLVLCGESARRRDEQESLPFSGAPGILLSRNLDYNRINRDQCHETYAVLCRTTKKMAAKEWKQALACCRPRLEAEIKAVTAHKPTVVALGNKALHAFAGKHSAVAWRGAPLEGKEAFKGLTVFPTLCPSRHIKYGNQANEPLLRLDLGRAKELPKWTWPKFIIRQGKEMQDALKEMRKAKKPIGVDVETCGTNPMYDKLLCIGIANEDMGISCVWPPNAKELQLIQQILADGSVAKTMHNGQHDLLSLEHNNLPCNGYDFDTLLAHAIVAPQLKHDLGLVASCFYPATRWKSIFRVTTDKKGAEAFTKRDPLELRDYNCKDAYMTALIRRDLEQCIEGVHNGRQLFSEAQQLAGLSLRMCRKGLVPNEEAYIQWTRTLADAANGSQRKFESLRPDSSYELGKVGQHKSLKRLFFTHFGVEPYSYSDKTDEPSLDTATLKVLTGSSNKRASELAKYVLAYRRNKKLSSTYIDNANINPITGLIHPTFKTFGTVTGRWSSSKPNMQNQPKPLRDLYRARDGMYLVAADYGQLEARILALLSGDHLLLQWFREGKSPHIEHAKLFYELPDDWHDKKDFHYKLTKCVVYAMSYGGGPEKIWKTVLPDLPGTEFGMVKDTIKKYNLAHPQIVAWKRNMIKDVQRLHYVEAPLSGRREYFHDDVSVTQAMNFPMQATAGDIMNRAILAIDKEIRWDKGESILLQVHDEIVLEGPDPERLTNLLYKHMEQVVTLGGNSLFFPVEASMGKDWGNMKDIIR